MHVLSDRNRSEFLACPQLVRFEHAAGADGWEPTLLVKASTLLLKYIIRGVPLSLMFARLDDRLMFCLKIIDDPEKAASLWSIVEYAEELTALAAIGEGKPCQVFLFNELALSVAWAEFKLNVPQVQLTKILLNVVIEPVDYSSFTERVNLILDDRLGTENGKGISVSLDRGVKWTLFENILIKNNAKSSSLNLLSNDEGSQQEQVCVWLTDNLQPFGAHHSPQIPSGKQKRELIDILLNHEYGAILIESKTLAIFSRDSLPSRTKLAGDVSGHIEKAVSQLRGAIRKIKSGIRIVDKMDVDIEVERLKPMHAIVLIPEFDLVTDRAKYGHQYARDGLNKERSDVHGCA